MHGMWCLTSDVLTWVLVDNRLFTWVGLLHCQIWRWSWDLALLATIAFLLESELMAGRITFRPRIRVSYPTFLPSTPLWLPPTSCRSVPPQLPCHHCIGRNPALPFNTINNQTWNLSKNLQDQRFQGKKFTQKTRNFRHLLNRNKKCVNALNWDKTSKKCSVTM